MTYAFTMRGCQRIGDLNRTVQRLVQGASLQLGEPSGFPPRDTP